MKFGLAALAPRSAHHIYQLCDLAPLVGLVPAVDRVIHAMRDVFAQNFLFNAA